MTRQKSCRRNPSSPCAAIAFGLAAGLLLALPVRAALTPAQIKEIQSVQGSRIEAMTILAGDVGLSGGNYAKNDNKKDQADISISSFGGFGDVGSPKPLGDTGIGWQPRLQGNMGYMTATKKLKTPLLNGDKSEFDTFAIQFGGGVRFWFDEHFSIAPTFMGMYGHTENHYTANSAFGLANKAEAKQLGLIDWTADTWTIRPSLDFQYQYTWHRTVFTLSSDPTYFYTDTFSSSAKGVGVDGNSETWKNKIDVDVPLRLELFGHELRSGGYVSRTELYDGIRDGLNTDYVYDVHGRVVLDFLGELWKVKWIGLGVSRLWGSNFTGWSIGADVAFRF